MKTAEGDTIEAKFLVGAEEAASSLRKQLGIPFDGSTTDVHWPLWSASWRLSTLISRLLGKRNGMHKFDILTN